jgi:hypothetical protein
MMELVGITNQIYPMVREEMLPFLREFSRASGMSLGWFEARILAGETQCWAAGDNGVKAVCITEIHGPTLCINYATGTDLPDWVGMITEIMRFAKENKCTNIRVECRPGYEKHLAQHAFRKTHVILERSL